MADEYVHAWRFYSTSKPAKPRKRTVGSIPVDRVPWHEPSLLDDVGAWEQRPDGTERYWPTSILGEELEQQHARNAALRRLHEIKLSVADSQTRGVEERQARELATENQEA